MATHSIFYCYPLSRDLLYRQTSLKEIESGNLLPFYSPDLLTDEPLFFKWL
jgi:hypothetical protein